jgi:hypothetical protein
VISHQNITTPRQHYVRVGDAMNAFGHIVADMRGKIPESWACIDCGINTGPGLLNRRQAEQAFAADWENRGVQQTVDEWSEVYVVKRQYGEPHAWTAMAAVCVLVVLKYASAEPWCRRTSSATIRFSACRGPNDCWRGGMAWRRA